VVTVPGIVMVLVIRGHEKDMLPVTGHVANSTVVVIVPGTVETLGEKEVESEIVEMVSNTV
jgi:hypothetical protein